MLIRKLFSSLKKRSETRRTKALFKSLEVVSIENQEKLGTDYGGWFVPVDLLDSESVCYCAGAGEDVSFDVELIRRIGCNVYTFDPTPRAVRHVEGLIANTKIGIRTEINNNPNALYDVSPERIVRLHFHDFGVWSKNDKLKFYAPKIRAHVSHSIVNLQETHEYFGAQCYTVRHIMAMFNHSLITLLKLDIEGAEYAVLDSIMGDGIKPRILCVEFGHGRSAIDKEFVGRIRGCVSQLDEYGYVLTHVDGWDFTFVGKGDQRTCHRGRDAQPHRPHCNKRVTAIASY